MVEVRAGLSLGLLRNFRTEYVFKNNMFLKKTFYMDCIFPKDSVYWVSNFPACEGSVEARPGFSPSRSIKKHFRVVIQSHQSHPALKICYDVNFRTLPAILSVRLNIRARPVCHTDRVHGCLPSGTSPDWRAACVAEIYAHLGEKVARSTSRTCPGEGVPLYKKSTTLHVELEGRRRRRSA